MKIAIFGAGYVGCVTAASLASLGHSIWLVESSESKLASLQDAESPIVEPGIDQLLPDLIRKKKIIPIAEAKKAVDATDLALVCVGTPALSDGTTDIRQVQGVLEELIAALKGRKAPYTIAFRSTIPYPLLAKDLLPALKRGIGDRYGEDIFFALNPEFLREGSAMKDFMAPPFVVIGTEHAPAADLLKKLYQDLKAPTHVVPLGSASLLKYACNAFHALKIVFTNELASLSSLFDADAKQVMEIFSEDKILNISPAYLRPGFAYGGSCLPKDLKTLVRLSAASAIPTPLLDSIEESNRQLIDNAVQAVSEFGVQKIGLVGLTFKAGTDDFRNSPLVEIAERLLGKGFELMIFDPDVDMRKIHGQNLRYIEKRMKHLAQLLCPDFRSLAERSELVVIGKSMAPATSWLAQVPADRCVLDLTRQLAPKPEKPRIVHLEALSGAAAAKK